MKLTWGAGLVVVFLIFAAGILTMVVISMSRDVDLVTEDYYQQELRHEQQIESEKRSNALGDGMHITHSASSTTITLPPECNPDSVRGTLTFYRPADRRKDFVVAIKLDSARSQHISTTELAKGLWRVKARWTLNGEAYYREEPLIIQ